VPSSLDRPRGIIFDLDGTLADTLPVCFDAYRLAFAKYVGHEWTDDQISALFGPSEEGVIRQVVPTRVVNDRSRASTPCWFAYAADAARWPR